MTVDGHAAPGFELVLDTFEDHHHEVGRGGAAFAAFAGGELVVDLWAGEARPGCPWQEDTLGVLMSTTKGMATACLMVLAHRGLLDVEAPVAEYWPEFACSGKHLTTVADVLTHTAGVIGLPHHDDILSRTGAGFDRYDDIASALAEAKPAWPPGTRCGYHAFTWGWIVGELVRRIDGRTLGTFFRQEIAEPLALDLWIGTPLEQQGRLATCLPAPSPPPPMDVSDDTARLLAEASLTFADGGSLIEILPEISNCSQYLTAEQPAANGTGTARGIGRLYAALACGGGLDGFDIVSPQQIDRFRTVRVIATDAVIGMPTRRALGFHGNGPPMWPLGPNEASFGHAGAGGQSGWADPDRGVAAGFVRSQFSMTSPLRTRLCEALYLCIDGAP